MKRKQRPCTLSKYSGVSHEDVNQPGVVADAEALFALVRQQSTHVDGEVHFIWQSTEQSFLQLVILILPGEVRGQTKVSADCVYKKNCLKGTRN